jgi:hypothetical protein
MQKAFCTFELAVGDSRSCCGGSGAAPAIVYPGERTCWRLARAVSSLLGAWAHRSPGAVAVLRFEHSELHAVRLWMQPSCIVLPWVDRVRIERGLPERAPGVATPSQALSGGAWSRAACSSWGFSPPNWSAVLPPKSLCLIPGAVWLHQAAWRSTDSCNAKLHQSIRKLRRLCSAMRSRSLF